MKKDVLILSQFFYPEYITSAVLPFETAVDLHKQGYSVGVLCGYPKNYNNKGRTPTKEVVEGVTITRINYPNFDKNRFIGRLLNYFAFTFAMIMNIGKIRNYESVIVYSTPPVLPIVPAIANVFFKTKIIFVSYDIYPEVAVRMGAVKENNIISKIMGKINDIVFKRVSKVVALSTEMKEFIVNNRRISSDKVKIIPNWANPVELKNKELVNNPLFNNILEKNKTIISYFGNMGTAQDMNTILAAIRLLKDNEEVHFLFAGHGNKMDQLRGYVREEALQNVSIFEFLHDEDFRDAQAISDGFIVSLEKNLDGLCVPSKTYSYMSAGRPIISIMNPACDISQDLVKYKAGFAINNGESSKLVDIIHSLKDSEIANKMGKNCKKLYEDKYTREICTSAYGELVQNVLEEK